MEELPRIILSIGSLEVGDLPLQSIRHLQKAAERYMPSIALEKGDPLSILFDWHQFEQEEEARLEVEKLIYSTYLVAANMGNAIKAKNIGKEAQIIHNKYDAGMLKILAKANITEKEQGFRTYAYEPTKKSAKKAVQIIEDALKNNWISHEIENECAISKMGKADTAFILNFAKVYYPAFADEPDLREEPADMVEYIRKERASGFLEKGYFSYFISALNKDGTPAGFVSGAVGSTKRIMKYVKEKKAGKDLVINFVGYVALERSAQGSGVDSLLLAQAEALVRQSGRSTDYFLTQVDRPAKMAEELLELEGRIEKARAGGEGILELVEERDSLKRRIRAANLLLRLWGGRYELKEVQGLRSVEAIMDYDDLKSPITAPQEQPELALLIRPVSENKQSIPKEDLEVLLKGLYAYYGVHPSRRIEGGEKNALQAYLDFSMQNVRAEGEMAKLQNPYI